MSQAIKLQDLMEVDAVFGAVRWQESKLGKAVAYPPRLVEYVGFQNEERARHLMLSCEAMGLSIKGVMEMDYYDDRARFRTTVMPVDSFLIHGQKYSILCTLNRVAALLDNAVRYDVQALSLKLVLVRND
jgi:hypothetical protein